MTREAAGGSSPSRLSVALQETGAAPTCQSTPRSSRAYQNVLQGDPWVEKILLQGEGGAFISVCISVGGVSFEKYLCPLLEEMNKWTHGDSQSRWTPTSISSKDSREENILKLKLTLLMPWKSSLLGVRKRKKPQARFHPGRFPQWSPHCQSPPSSGGSLQGHRAGTRALSHPHALVRGNPKAGGPLQVARLLFDLEEREPQETCSVKGGWVREATTRLQGRQNVPGVERARTART